MALINQKESKKSKMEILVGKRVSVGFIFGAGEIFGTKDIVQKRKNAHPRYFLQSKGLSLPLIYLHFGSNNDLTVNVPAGSPVSYQLNRIINAD